MQGTTRLPVLPRFSIRRSSLIFMRLLTLALMSSSYAATTSGAVTPAISTIGGSANDRIGSNGGYAN